jgi:hypothetical protein
MGRGGTEWGGGAPELPERRRQAPSAVEYRIGEILAFISRVAAGTAATL